MDPALLRSFKIKQGSVRCVCILDDNSFAAAGTSLGSVLLFPLQTGLRPKQLTGHQDVVSCIEPIQDSSFFITGSKDGTVRIWRDQDSTVIRPNDGPIKNISISLTSDLPTKGPVVLIIGKNGNPSIWSADTCQQLVKLPNHEQITSGVMSNDGAICMTGSEDGICRFFNSSSGKEIKTFKAAAPVSCVALCENEPYAVAGCRDGEISLFHFKRNSVTEETQIHDGPIVSIQFHPTMNLIITGSEDQKIQIINSTTLKIKYTLEGHKAPIRCVKWSDDGEKLISCADDQGILILSSPGDDLSEIEEEEEDTNDDENDELAEEASTSYHPSKTKSTATFPSSDSAEAADEEITEPQKTEEELKIEKLQMILGQIIELKNVLFRMNERISKVGEKIQLIEKAQEEENTNVVIRANKK